MPFLPPFCLIIALRLGGGAILARDKNWNTYFGGRASAKWRMSLSRRSLDTAPDEIERVADHVPDDCVGIVTTTLLNGFG